MRIDPRSTIAGQPSLAVRELLRRGRTGEWGAPYVQAVLDIGPDEAERVLTALRNQGFIEPGISNAGEQLYRLTVRGRALAGASAGKPIQRSTAERLLREFLDRVDLVNSDPHYLFRVEHVVVFGSYLSGANDLGDVDVAIHMERKELDWDTHVTLEDKRIAEARAAGRTFRSYEEEVAWPETEVYRFLKSRSEGLSIHDLRSDARIIATGPFRVVFPRGETELPEILLKNASSSGTASD
jgi:predicted nucleotidyltransferase